MLRFKLRINIDKPKPTNAKPAAANPMSRKSKVNIITNNTIAVKQISEINFSKFVTLLTLLESKSNPSRLSIGLPLFRSNSSLILRELSVELAPSNNITELNT
ncbi:hypothetical protein ES703_115982 [subsurface metagenome]